jgi:hypothetical protein
MKRSVDLMARHPTSLIVKYNDVFFEWLRNQMLMVNDYTYIVLDFHGDPDLALPECSQWRDIGKKEVLFI